ncbi:nitroreductase family protein [Streptomyces sp. 15-116A]|uniref:nitroreductase family protein n=1 Tax=Streptomyces sp. 15-116A TaxID=2259035 RepID=UPI0021B2C3B6|nr:nitroreductase family protein [Streptomyces sp. 15-116A]MCT7352020.1 nitroreductase family protein [Streptomyces sp. 15-116A]
MRSIPVLDPDTVESLLTAAAAAPSIHNTQPWRFRMDADSGLLEVHAVRPGSRHPVRHPRHRPRTT